MRLEDATSFFETYHLILIIIGFAILAATVLPRFLSKYPLSMPIILMVSGYLLYMLPIKDVVPDFAIHGDYIEHISELAVIIAVMAAGLKINRRPNFKTWAITWRLLGITMVLTIAAAALIGWWLASFVPATALLLGAVIAPTDPVLASELEEEGPGENLGQKNELKFALTSEAGLNDGLAFPFTNMAIAMAMFGAHPSNWFGSWLTMNVVYELLVGILIGLGSGYLLAKFILNLSADSKFAKSVLGIGSLAATLIIYGITEFFGGYGFIAVFCGAVAIRQYEPNHEYQVPLHAFTEKVEVIFTSLILLGLGAAINAGVLQYLNLSLIIIAVLMVLVIRPLCGMIGLLGFNKISWKERAAISFFGIRGIGSIYYLSYALNHQSFEGSEQLWSVVVLIIILSIFLHGVTASPILKHLKID